MLVPQRHAWLLFVRPNELDTLACTMSQSARTSTRQDASLRSINDVSVAHGCCAPAHGMWESASPGLQDLPVIATPACFNASQA
eukprot:14545881-Alexandrium_andersonii.AAC.1